MKPKPMTADEFQHLVTVRATDALNYCEEVGTDREKAIRYYKGDISQDLPAISGRSRVTSRDLRDTVLQIMPSLVRVFMGSQTPVEFNPVGPEDEQAADQATDYVNYIVRNDNPGFRVFWDVFKDALIQRCGVVKVWYEEKTDPSAMRFEGVDENVLGAFMAEAQGRDDVTVTEIEESEGELGVVYGFTVETRKQKKRVRIEALPPEEFVISRDARSSDRPSLIGHVCERTVSDLVAMGYDYDEVLEHASDRRLNEEDDARRIDFASDDQDDAGDPSMRNVVYGEIYILADKDGDGIAEMRKVCTVGEQFHVLFEEMVDDHPFADFCPDPEPHSFYGGGLYDILEDIQLIRSHLLRLGLDGLSSLVTPRQGYLEGQVNLKQLMDARPGGLVGMKTPDAVFPLATDKAAPQMALEAFRTMGELRQERTGQNQASMGLQPDALQSVSRIAANDLVQTAQARVEMIARIFAETGMRRLFRLILKLITRYQDKERIVRLRGTWVPMDPRTWNPDMDVTVNVGTGKGNLEEKAVYIDKILQAQQLILQQSGLQNPWVDEEKVRNALEDMAELGGKHAQRYFMTADEWQQKVQQIAQQQANKPPEPDPQSMGAQAMLIDAQSKAQERQANTQIKAQEAIAKDDRERDKLDAEIVMKSMKEFGVDPQTVLSFIRQQRQGVMQ